VAKCTDENGFSIVDDTIEIPTRSRTIEAAALHGHVAVSVSICSDLNCSPPQGLLSNHVAYILTPMIHNFKPDEHSVILADRH
jgi:hypothetical protein